MRAFFFDEFEQPLRAVFDEVGDEFEAFGSAVVGIGDFGVVVL